MKKVKIPDLSGEHYWQGDLLFIRRAVMPLDATAYKREEGERFVIAVGEASGHAHVVEEDMAEAIEELERIANNPLNNPPMMGNIDSDNTWSYRVGVEIRDQGLRVRSFRNSAPVTVKHEEHPPITLPPGAWDIRRQREYEPTEQTRQRQVED